mmetsp:Transcript_9843/g.18611  ORF Transcript_9843/g.18611 Transcript_9843/m.18611 type:complete len:106 (+) Transcript_9843:1785-2102(+)
MRVTRSGLDFEDPSINRQQRDIKGATTQIKDQNILFSPGLIDLVQPVRDGSCCGLVDDAQHFQSCNGTSIFGGLPLGVVEIGWDGDHCLGHIFAEKPICCLFHLH